MERRMKTKPSLQRLPRTRWSTAVMGTSGKVKRGVPQWTSSMLEGRYPDHLSHEFCTESAQCTRNTLFTALLQSGNVLLYSTSSTQGTEDTH